jgi:uncharacterized protein
MENTVAQKLEALVKLQTIDSKLMDLQKVRGDLPEEVRDLEDELAGYETRISKYQSDIEALQLDISNNKQASKDAEKLIKKYEEQQMNVRNNREYDAITKEVELQNLEIQICEKRTKEAHVKIGLKNQEIEETSKILEERKKDLSSKKSELNQITSESQDEENTLLKEREKQSKLIEERLLNSYNKLRNNTSNGLAVVAVKRDACGGCFNTVPPQRQGDIREKKKIIVCEHCGRILADVDAPVLETAKK